MPSAIRIFLAVAALIAAIAAGALGSRVFERAPFDPGALAAAAMPAVVKIEVRVPARFGGGEETSYGSGFFVAGAPQGEGFIVTSAHVVASATAITATLADGRRVPAAVRGLDRLSDLAVLTVALVPPATLALGDESALSIGDPVIAIGAPFGFGHSLSAGLVSGFDRPLDPREPVGLVQHDAALNPGNSGGPLIDAMGRVAGINTAIPYGAFSDVGVSLATPVSLLRDVFVELATGGQVARAYLGASVRTLEGPLAEAIGLAAEAAVAVEAVEPDGPAAKAGLRPGDFLTAVGETRAVSARAVAQALMARRAGDRVQLGVLRGGERISLSAVLGVRSDTPTPDAQPAVTAAGSAAGAAAPVDLGFTLSDGPGGPVIAGVVPDGAAARARLRPGDQILAVGRVQVDSADGANAALAAAHGGRLALLVRRGEVTSYVVLRRVSDPGGDMPFGGNASSSATASL